MERTRSTPIRLTSKQAMVLDYMRGNGGVLTDAGYDHLLKRGSFNKRGLSRVLDNLVDRGLIKWPHGPLTMRDDPSLTQAGLRASEAVHR